MNIAIIGVGGVGGSFGGKLTRCLRMTSVEYYFIAEIQHLAEIPKKRPYSKF